MKFSLLQMLANIDCKNEVSPQEMTIEGLKCILECTVCLATPNAPPVHRCNNGHIICSICRPQLTKEKCPVCRIQLGNLRCLTTEKIISDMPIDCRFKEQGCMLKLPKDPMKKHELMCSFSMVNCSEIIVTCRVNVPLLQLISHFKKDHGDFIEFMNEEMFAGMSLKMNHGIRGENVKLWKWGVNNELSKTCQFIEKGCQVECSKIQLNRHETECNESLLKCSNVVRNGCNKSIPLLKLQTHLKHKHKKVFDGAKHGQTFYGKVRQIWNGDKVDWPWELESTESLFLNGQMFLPILIKKNNIVHCWVFILHNDEVAKTYECEITLQNNSERNKKISFTGPCVHSILHPKEVIIDAKIHFSTSLFSIHGLLNHGKEKFQNELNYSFTMKKLRI